LNDPAQIVFTLDSKTSESDLQRLAKLIFSLKGERPSDPDKQMLAREVTDEIYRPNDFVKVPDSLGYGMKTYITHVWIERERLSGGYIQRGASLKFNVYLVDGEPYTIRFMGDS
jgi:hypothetical protein